MSDARKFQLNIKFGGGYEAPLLNIEGDDEAEFQKNVAFAVDNVEHIVDAAVLFQASYNVKKPSDNPPPTQSQQKSWSNSGSQQSSQPAATNTGGPAPTCRHGEMKYVAAGVSKRTNKPYDAFWSCTGPRNEQCDTVKA